MKELTTVDLEMLKKFFYIVAVILFMGSSCKGQKNISSDDTKSVSDMELIVTDNYSGSETEETQIITDQKSLESFYGKINRTRKPGLPIPEIDFTKEMILVWCAGEGIQDIPQLSISKETTDTYFVSKHTTVKKLKSTAVISPFSVYKLPKTSKKIVLE